MLKFFGLVKSEENAETGQIPAWQGATTKQRMLSIAISLALTVIMFLASSWLLDDSAGFARYVPGLLACQTLLLCGAISERALLRTN